MNRETESRPSIPQRTPNRRFLFHGPSRSERALQTPTARHRLDRRVGAARGRVYHRENLRAVVARDAATGWALAGRGNDGWRWLLASGVVSLLLAVLLRVGSPSTAVWAVGVLFGVNLLTTGVTLIALGMATRQTAEEGTPADERGPSA
jgi:hypothetical protein